MPGAASFTDHYCVILNILTNLAYTQDSLDMSLCKSLFIQDSPVFYDTSDHTGSHDSYSMLAVDFVEHVWMALREFDATQHVLSSPQINIDKSGMAAQAKVAVDVFHLLRPSEAWKCDYMMMNVTWSVGLIREGERLLIKSVLVENPFPLEEDPSLHVASHPKVIAGDVRESSSTEF